MGITYVKVKVGNPGNGKGTEEVNCLVDSGAVYSLAPQAILRRLGIKPHSKREFILANGEVIERRLATATFEYEGRRGDSMVIVGEPGGGGGGGGGGPPPAPHSGNRNEAMRVRHGAEPVVWTYSVVNQNVQSSDGSTEIEL